MEQKHCLISKICLGLFQTVQKTQIQALCSWKNIGIQSLIGMAQLGGLLRSSRGIAGFVHWHQIPFLRADITAMGDFRWRCTRTVLGCYDLHSHYILLKVPILYASYWPNMRMKPFMRVDGELLQLVLFSITINQPFILWRLENFLNIEKIWMKVQIDVCTRLRAVRRRCSGATWRV